MSQSWICIFCGETIISKCPGARNSFPGMIEGIIGSVTTFNHVKDMEGNLSELFISYTSGAKDAAAAFKDLVELMKDNMDYPSKNVCNHMYVINSATQTVCTLDHTHPNLNDVDRLREEFKSRGPKKQTIKHLLKEYAEVAIIPVEQARKDVNRTKSKFDTAVEQDFYTVKNNIRRDLDRIADGESVQDLFRVRIPVPYPKRDRCVPFRNMDDAIDFVYGRALRGQISMLETLDETGERYIDVPIQPRHICVICQHEANPAESIVAITAEGPAHVTCINKRKRDSEVRRHTSILRVVGNRASWEKECVLKDKYNLEYINLIYIEEKNKTQVNMAAICDMAAYEGIVKAVKQELI